MHFTIYDNTIIAHRIRAVKTFLKFCKKRANLAVCPFILIDLLVENRIKCGIEVLCHEVEAEGVGVDAVNGTPFAVCDALADRAIP